MENQRISQLKQCERNSLNSLYTLIPFNEFKVLIGIDDREDKNARFCLTTATLNIEQYCKRKFLKKQYFETFKWTGDLVFPLKEFPVTEIISMNSEQLKVNNGLIDPSFYRPYPGCSFGEELPFEILLSPSLKPYKLAAVKVIYWAGYSINNEKLEVRNDLASNHSMIQKDEDCGQEYCSLFTDHCSLPVPADLAAACMELAAWNFNRYRGKRIGLTGNIRGAGVQGEHFEISMPINVRELLEPYRRKVI